MGVYSKEVLHTRKRSAITVAKRLKKAAAKGGRKTNIRVVKVIRYKVIGKIK